MSSSSTAIPLRTAALLGCCIVLGSMVGVSVVVTMPVAAESGDDAAALPSTRKGDAQKRKAAKRHAARSSSAGAQATSSTRLADKEQKKKQEWSARLSNLTRAYEERKKHTRRSATRALDKSAGKLYVALPAGTNCSAGGPNLVPVASYDECRTAVKSVGGMSLYPKTQSKKHYQKGCSRCNRGCSKWDLNVLFFNTRDGANNPNHDTVCRKLPVAVDAPPQPSADSSKDSSKGDEASVTSSSNTTGTEA